MPQMMPIYWLFIFMLCLFMHMLILILINSYFIINMINYSFKYNTLKKYKSFNKFKFKWN